MPVEYWNPVPIYYDDLSTDEFDLIRQEILTKLKPEMFNKTTWHDLVSTTTDISKNIINYLNLNFLKIVIINHVNYFINSLSFQKPLSKLVLTNSWFNKTYKYGFQNTHLHIQSEGIVNNTNYISGVYYYDYYDDNFQCPLVFKLYNNVKMEDVIYQYIPGRIIIFHGLTPHCVFYNQSEKPRTSFSFNFTYE